jgi:AcrR family transcriptional regulator
VAKSNSVQIGRQPTTKWGDREQRRIDILDAARTRIAEGGYLALNMRDLAAGAGVSPATLYSYFATKEELFATLYAEAIRRHTETFRPVADQPLALEELLVRAIEHHLELYRSYGRHFTLWSEMRVPDSFPKDLIVSLRTATKEHNRLLMQAIHAAAARDGKTIVDDQLVPTFLWSALNGLADHFTSERRALDRFPAKRLITFSAESLTRAIATPR